MCIFADKSYWPMHTQFSKLCQEAVLYKAWNYVKSKGSAGGIDGVTIESFNKDKIHQIKLIQEELKNGTWKPQPYLQIAIPKRKEDEIIRLVMLCVKMGRVEVSGIWREPTKGIPQGAVLSPLLANLYLHSFDQFAISKELPYARYGDDSFMLCKTQEQAVDIQVKAQRYLNSKLKLSLNTPAISPISEGFDFLGVTIMGQKVFITEEKKAELEARVLDLYLCPEGLSPKSLKTWDGMRNYYAKLLPQKDLEFFDAALIRRISFVIENTDVYKSKAALLNSINNISFLSKLYQKQSKQHTEDLVGIFLNTKCKDKQLLDEKTNQEIIQERKKEYGRIETETSGLLVDKAGTFIGLTSRGITATYKGKVVARHHKDNLSQIIITGKGVSLSSNLIIFCLSNKIPIDFKMEQIIQKQAKQLAKAFDDIDAFKPYIAKW